MSIAPNYKTRQRHSRQHGHREKMQPEYKIDGKSGRYSGRKLRVLIDINHPADVHQFNHVIRILEKRGHKVLVTARQKECTFDLLHYYGISFIPRKGFSGWKKLPGIIYIDWKLWREAKRFKPDVLVGSSGDLYVAHAARLLRRQSLIVDDTEHSKIQNLLTFPFATRIVTPETYSLNLGKKHFTYRGFKELAYCSPKYFHPHRDILKKLGVSPNEKYFVIRTVSWEASHDIGTKSQIPTQYIIKALKKQNPKSKIFITSESELPRELSRYKLKTEPAELLHVLYHARLVVSEGGTTAAEAAALGTPAIYINPLMPGYIQTIIKAGLIKSAGSTAELEKAATEFLSSDRSRVYYRNLSAELASKATDINTFLADTIEELAMEKH